MLIPLTLSNLLFGKMIRKMQNYKQFDTAPGLIGYLMTQSTCFGFLASSWLSSSRAP